MARAKNIKDPLHNDAENQEDSSAPVLSRRVNASQLSTLLGHHRNTVMTWPKAGCPVVQQADVSIGSAWVFDVADVVRWLRAEDVKKALAKFEEDEGGEVSEAVHKARRAKWAAIDAESEARKNLRTLLPVKYVHDQISADYSKVREIIEKVPDIIAANVDSSIASHVRDIADKQVRNAMKSLQVKIVSEPLEYEKKG